MYVHVKNASTFYGARYKIKNLYETTSDKNSFSKGV